jgi:hypothetical protein
MTLQYNISSIILECTIKISYSNKSSTFSNLHHHTKLLSLTEVLMLLFLYSVT